MAPLLLVRLSPLSLPGKKSLSLYTGIAVLECLEAYEIFRQTSSLLSLCVHVRVCVRVCVPPPLSLTHTICCDCVLSCQKAGCLQALDGYSVNGLELSSTGIPGICELLSWCFSLGWLLRVPLQQLGCVCMHAGTGTHLM